MAEREENESRTEEPTARRRQQSRDEGRIARSQELSAALMLVAGTMLLASAGGRSIGAALTTLFRTAPGWIMIDPPTVGGAVSLIRTLIGQALVAALPLGIGLVIVALGAGLIQSRGSASSKPLAPDWSRVNPMTGLKRIVGLCG